MCTFFSRTFTTLFSGNSTFFPCKFTTLFSENIIFSRKCSALFSGNIWLFLYLIFFVVSLRLYCQRIFFFHKFSTLFSGNVWFFSRNFTILISGNTMFYQLFSFKLTPFSLAFLNILPTMALIHRCGNQLEVAIRS